MLGTLELVAVSEGYQTVSSMRPAELTECDDVVLLSRSRSGDVAAFGELVRRHQDAALRLAAVIGGSTEEAKDIVQDVFVSVHGSLSSTVGRVRCVRGCFVWLRTTPRTMCAARPAGDIAMTDTPG